MVYEMSNILEFRMHGMDCAEEVSLLKDELGPLVGGVDRLSFDLLNRKLIVDARGAKVSASDVIDSVARTGMRAEIWTDSRKTSVEQSFWQQNGRMLLTITSGLFGLLGFAVSAWLGGSLRAALGSEGMGMAHSVPTASIGAYLVGILSGVWYVLPKAWRSAKTLRPDMNLLMTVAVIGAAAIGEWLEATTVAFLFSVSLLLESWSVGRARRAIAALMDLAPQMARVRDKQGSEKEIAVAEVQVGTAFTVRPGEKIPLDGLVLKGSSAVNQAPITGESVPVQKDEDAEVFAGTINGDGTLIIESSKLADDTTLARIIKMVGEAQSKRSPSEQWVERFARYYTPFVMALAAVVLTCPLQTSPCCDRMIGGLDVT